MIHSKIYINTIDICFFRLLASFKSYVVPLFYTSLIIICTIGQTAIFAKKLIEKRKDKIRLTLINQNLEKNKENNSLSKPLKNNNKRWNDYLCNNAGLFVIIIVVALMAFLWNPFGQYISLGNLDENTQNILKLEIQYLILTVAIPAYVYAKTDKLFNHVKTEIFEFV